MSETLHVRCIACGETCEIEINLGFGTYWGTCYASPAGHDWIKIKEDDHGSDRSWDPDAGAIACRQA